MSKYLIQTIYPRFAVSREAFAFADLGKWSLLNSCNWVVLTRLPDKEVQFLLPKLQKYTNLNSICAVFLIILALYFFLFCHLFFILLYLYLKELGQISATNSTEAQRASKLTQLALSFLGEATWATAAFKRPIFAGVTLRAKTKYSLQEQVG